MAPGVEEDHSADDAEIAELRARLGRAVAVRRELQRKLATLRKSERLWDEHRAAVEQLSASRHADAMTRMLNDANRIRQMAGGTDLPLSGQPQPPPPPPPPPPQPAPTCPNLPQPASTCPNPVPTLSQTDMPPTLPTCPHF